jgi:hypothetical protein
LKFDFCPLRQLSPSLQPQYEEAKIRASIAPLQSQPEALTVTAAAGFSNVAETDVFGSIYRDHIRTFTPRDISRTRR